MPAQFRQKTWIGSAINLNSKSVFLLNEFVQMLIQLNFKIAQLWSFFKINAEVIGTNSRSDIESAFDSQAKNVNLPTENFVS